MENAAAAESFIPMVFVSILLFGVLLGRVPVEPQQVLCRNLELVRIDHDRTFDSAITEVRQLYAGLLLSHPWQPVCLLLEDRHQFLEAEHARLPEYRRVRCVQDLKVFEFERIRQRQGRNFNRLLWLFLVFYQTLLCACRVLHRFCEDRITCQSCLDQ